jgi:hypothetical protein
MGSSHRACSLGELISLYSVAKLDKPTWASASRPRETWCKYCAASVGSELLRMELTTLKRSAGAQLRTLSYMAQMLFQSSVDRWEELSLSTETESVPVFPTESVEDVP